MQNCGEMGARFKTKFTWNGDVMYNIEHWNIGTEAQALIAIKVEFFHRFPTPDQRLVALRSTRHVSAFRDLFILIQCSPVTTAF